MPLSSFLLKPMQRITRYPLLIRSVSAPAGTEEPDPLRSTEAVVREPALPHGLMDQAPCVCAHPYAHVRGHTPEHARTIWVRQRAVQCHLGNLSSPSPGNSPGSLKVTNVFFQAGQVPSRSAAVEPVAHESRRSPRWAQPQAPVFLLRSKFVHQLNTFP